MEGESPGQRDERLKALWRQLDVKRKGSLDLQSLKSGLAQMNHRTSIRLCSNVALHQHKHTHNMVAAARTAAAAAAAVTMRTQIIASQASKHPRH